MTAKAVLAQHRAAKNSNKTAKINVKNFHGNLTTVVRAQNDTSKTAISPIPFSIEHWYSPYKRRRFENRSDHTFCILLIEDVLSVNLHSLSLGLQHIIIIIIIIKSNNREAVTARTRPQARCEGKGAIIIATQTFLYAYTTEIA